MKKLQLIDAVAAKAQITKKEAAAAVDAVLDVVAEALAAVKNLAQGQRIILQETLRDSSLMLRNEVRWPKGKAMTRCYKDFVAPKFTKNQKR